MKGNGIELEFKNMNWNRPTLVVRIIIELELIAGNEEQFNGNEPCLGTHARAHTSPHTRARTHACFHLVFDSFSLVISLQCLKFYNNL